VYFFAVFIFDFISEDLQGQRLEVDNEVFDTNLLLESFTFLFTSLVSKEEVLNFEGYIFDKFEFSVKLFEFLF
jgi:hypothetical protein